MLLNLNGGNHLDTQTIQVDFPFKELFGLIITSWECPYPTPPSGPVACFVLHGPNQDSLLSLVRDERGLSWKVGEPECEGLCFRPGFILSGVNVNITQRNRDPIWKVNFHSPTGWFRLEAGAQSPWARIVFP